MTQKEKDPKATLTFSGFGNGLQQFSIIAVAGYYFAGQMGYLDPAPIPVDASHASKALAQAEKNANLLLDIQHDIDALSSGRSPQDMSGVPLWHRHSAEMEALVRAIERNNKATFQGTQALKETTVALNSLTVAMRGNRTAGPSSYLPDPKKPDPPVPEPVWARFWEWLSRGSAG